MDRIKRKTGKDKSIEDEKDKNNPPAPDFAFDIADRHRAFFEYIRDKKWDSVASYLEKKSVLYSGKSTKFSI